MKKQFFYAALAIAMMSSCSSNDTPGAQEPNSPDTPDVEDKVAIELGISSPVAAVNVSTKAGSGPVGSQESGDNNWNGQELKILMFDSSNNLVMENTDPSGTGGNYIFEGLTAKAPTSDATGPITFYTDASATTKQYKYYPQTGAYKFFGYYADNAEIAPDGDYLGYPQTDGKVKLEIDGTQDILAAATAEVTEDGTAAGSAYASQVVDPGDGFTWQDMEDRSFSAWTARRGLKPVLNFEHQLARLRFYVVAGEAKAASKKGSGESWTEKDEVTVGSDTHVKQGVFITRLVAKNLNKALSLNVLGSTGIEVSANDDATNSFPLCSYAAGTTIPEAGVDEAGTNTGEYLKSPVAPEYFKSSTSTIPASASENTLVGDIMFYPTNITQIPISLTLSEAVVDTEAVSSGDKTYIKKGETLPDFTIDATRDVKDVSDQPVREFKPGYQYNIYITVYGYQQIEVHATLTQWQVGGSGNFNPGDTF